MARTKSRVLNKVKELRFLNKEMTQQDLAKKIGVSRQTIIAIEQRKFCPSLESALRMARVFNVSVDDVFTLEDGVEQNSSRKR
jgi:putative transcriptional regulator